MTVVRSLMFFLLGIAAYADEPIKLEPLRVRPSDLYFKVGFHSETDEVTEIRVSEVAPGSAAEKIGIRAGDLLTAIRGEPVVGKKRSQVIAPNGRIKVGGLLTFVGHRGILRRKWSVTVEATSLRETQTPNKALEPTRPAVTDRAPSSTLRASWSCGSPIALG